MKVGTLLGIMNVHKPSEIMGKTEFFFSFSVRRRDDFKNFLLVFM